MIHRLLKSDWSFILEMTKQEIEQREKAPRNIGGAIERELARGAHADCLLTCIDLDGVVDPPGLLERVAWIHSKKRDGLKVVDRFSRMDNTRWQRARAFGRCNLPRNPVMK
jgi:hypothetical protein